MKRNNFTAYRYAKKVLGLSFPEKQAIVIIADACGTLEGVCTKSLDTMAAEHGICKRTLQYGIHGRHEQKSPIAGLLSRDLITTDGSTHGGIRNWTDRDNRTGITTHWRINARSFMSYLSEKDAAEVWALLHPEEPSTKGEHKGAGEASKGAGNGDKGASDAHNFPDSIPRSTSPKENTTPSPSAPATVHKSKAAAKTQATALVRELKLLVDEVTQHQANMFGGATRTIKQAILDGNLGREIIPLVRARVLDRWNNGTDFDVKNIWGVVAEQLEILSESAKRETAKRDKDAADLEYSRQHPVRTLFDDLREQRLEEIAQEKIDVANTPADQF